MRRLVVSVIVAAVVALGAAVAPGSPAYGNLAWEVGAYPVLEGSPVHFWVCAPGDLRDAPFLVDYATSDGTATAGEDYVATSGTLTFLPTESRCLEVVVDTIDDDLLEGVPFVEPTRENFFLDLSTAGVAEELFGDAAHTEARIHDDLDDWPMILDMTRATVTEGSKSGMVIWTPNPKPYPVTVEWETRAMSASTDDFVPSRGEITIPPGENQRWISIPTIDDALDEPLETFRIVLSGNRPADGSIIDPHALGPITLKDNDPMPRLSVADASTTVPASGESGTVEFSVSLSQPSGYVVGVDFATEDGTLAAGEDYEAVSGSLAFPPGVTSQTVSVSLTGPAQDLADGTLSLALDDPDNAGLGRSRATARVTVADDGPVPSIEPAPPAAPPITTPPPPVGDLTAATAEPSPAPAPPGRASALSEAPAGPRARPGAGSTPPLVRPAEALGPSDAVTPASEGPDPDRVLPKGESTASKRDPLGRLGGAGGAVLAVTLGWVLSLGRRSRLFSRF